VSPAGRIRGARFSVPRRTSVRRLPAQAGNSTLKRASRSGVTLIEMMIVVALIALIAGISFPAFSSGIDTLRLNQAAGGVVNFFNDALNRAERRGQVVEVSVSQAQNMLVMHSGEPGFERKYELPQGVSILRILPEAEMDADGLRHFLLFPGGGVPQAGIEIANQRNLRRIVRVDPITGVPQIERAGNR